ncbi:hypothetical protein [Enhygromyxa salina]|nr:hypothetical protein [Enhygromyxa salina]
MAAYPCPYCGHAISSEAPDQALERCPSCDGRLQIAYRYRLVAARGKISGGELYEAVDDGFGRTFAVLFIDEPDDPAAVERFIEGNHLFAELGGRGLVTIREIGTRSDRRPYVVMDWIKGGTLEAVVGKRGPFEQSLLFEIIADLLKGLAKAHRSMPAIVHGHIHPGKIGFLAQDQAVLFGFEWAKLVREQDSQFADAFMTETGPDDGARRATDLQQLGRSIYYAATGEWIADQSLAQQRAQARARLTGALGHTVDRMLGAGADGYQSAVDASMDFEDLLRGNTGWKARTTHRQDHSGDLFAKAWVNEDTRNFEDGGSEDADEPDAAEEFGDFDEALESIYDDDDNEPPPIPSRSWPSASPSPPPLHQPSHQHEQSPSARAIAFANAARKRQAEAAALAAAASPAKPGKVMGVVLGAMVMCGMCVAGVIDDIDDNYENPPPVFTAPEPEVIEVPSYEPVELPSYEPAPEIAETEVLSGLHHYTGKITGPADVAGFELGESCEIWIEPNPGKSLNCRWYVDCGEPRRRIYGGGDVGFSTCAVKDGHPTAAQDEDDDAPDGAFMAVLELEPMIIVTDRWLLPPTHVLISIDEGGGPSDGIIPDVPLAPRMSRDAIEAAIAAGDSPSFEADEVDEVDEVDEADEAGEADEEGPPEQLTSEQMLGVLNAQLEALQECPLDLSAQLTLTMDIHPTGRVGALELSPTQVPEAVKCVTRVLQSVRFPTFTGDTMSINWKVSW